MFYLAALCQTLRKVTAFSSFAQISSYFSLQPPRNRIPLLLFTIAKPRITPPKKIALLSSPIAALHATHSYAQQPTPAPPHLFTIADLHTTTRMHNSHVPNLHIRNF